MGRRGLRDGAAAADGSCAGVDCDDGLVQAIRQAVALFCDS